MHREKVRFPRKTVRSDHLVSIAASVTGWLVPPRPTLVGLLAFVAGCLQFQRISVIGEVYLAELVLPIAALFASATASARALWRTRAFVVLLGALGLTLLGFVTSDLVRETSALQYLRGWGRVSLLAVDFVALSMITAADRRNLWWFFLGAGVGGVMYLRIVEWMPISIWKFGYAEPVTYLLIATSSLLPLRWTAVSFAALSLVSLHFDFRIHAALCAVMGALLWYRAGGHARARLGLRQLSALVMLALIGVAAIKGIELATETEWHQQRREASDSGRAFGIRFGIALIRESPFIGYGSWARSQEIAQVERSVVSGMEDDRRERHQFTGSSSVVHSQILQAWVEGGVFGASFFMVFALYLLMRLPAQALRRPRDLVTPGLMYFHLYALWSLFMSPFASPTRMIIALGLVSILTTYLDGQSVGRFVSRSPNWTKRVRRNLKPLRGRAVKASE